MGLFFLSFFAYEDSHSYLVLFRERRASSYSSVLMELTGQWIIIIISRMPRRKAKGSHQNHSSFKANKISLREQDGLCDKSLSCLQIIPCRVPMVWSHAFLGWKKQVSLIFYWQSCTFVCSRYNVILSIIQWKLLFKITFTIIPVRR